MSRLDSYEQNRLRRDRAIVRDKLPVNTQELVIDGVTCFMFSVTCEFGRPYSIAIFWDGLYQAKCASPQVEGNGVHENRVFNDGRICLLYPEGGVSTLEDAYSKSVLWCTGQTVYEKTGTFPFRGD